MPTYAYACTVCDHRFEAVQAFTDDALTECPECGQRVRKVFTNVGVVFKGSGFYRTDSRADSKSRTGANGASGAPSGEKGSSEKSSSDTGSGDKGSGDKGSADKGSKDKGSSGSSSPATSGSSGSSGSSTSSGGAKAGSAA